MADEQSYGGLRTDQARWMMEQEKENARLRRAASNLTLDKLIRRKRRTRLFPLQHPGRHWDLADCRNPIITTF
ncbi:hypothetical protein ACMAUO_17740 [Gluconacetobacter sp. Hr-1-5]|uniref:hypothetical protein n=1 Tax=Gluconacetobacter sp. Hr-1-5 TaxID=3395370 RepID=UPI003B51CB41